MNKRQFPFGLVLYCAGLFMLGLYFAFSAIQGDYGVFKRAEILAEKQELEAQLSSLKSEVERMENLTMRLSDDFLDLDLLDEQARDVLGMTRADEIVIR